MPRFCVPELFLDANATTPVLPEIAEAMQHVTTTTFGNASSPHLAGLIPKSILQETRVLASRLFHGHDGRFLFNSGATEGINTAVLSALTDARNSKAVHTNPCLLYGATEHKAVPEALKHWNSVLGLGAEIIAIPVDSEGQLNMAFLQQHLSNALLLCTMGANNETGVVHDLAAIASVRNTISPEVPWLVDSVQVLGKLSLNLAALGIDYATFSAHKLYGPKGAGCLYVRNGSAYTPLQVGGGQESGERGGTENIAGVAAFRCIFSWLLGLQPSPLNPLAVLQTYRQQLLAALQGVFPNLVLNQPATHCLPTTINFAVPDYSSGELIAMFDAAGIRVSAGSACSTGKPRSFVLDAMGVPVWQSEGAIRLSFGPAASAQFIAQVCERLHEMQKRLASMQHKRYLLPQQYHGGFAGAHTSNEACLPGIRLLVPAPTEHGVVVFVDEHNRQAAVISNEPLQSVYQAWVQQRFSQPEWQVNWLQYENFAAGDTIQSLGQWRCIATDIGFSIINQANQRRLSFTSGGVVLSARERSSVKLIGVGEAANNDVHFIDVRDPLEAAMQRLPTSASAPTYAPRVLWCEFALTYTKPENSTEKVVTVCRSGGRSITVAALASAAGGLTLYSCEGGVTHIIEHLAGSA